MPPESSRLVWVTGAGSGIGSSLCREFSAHGSTVVLSGRNEKPLVALRDSIGENGGRAQVVLCDVRDERSVVAASRSILGSFGIPDLVINNAGVTVFKEFLETSVEEFDNIINTNLRGAFLVTRSMMTQMVKRRQGTILNVVSYAARTTYTESSVYAASKAGVTALMEGLRAEVRGQGIKIVNVFPGAVKTPIWHPKVQEKYGDRMMTSDEVAAMVYMISCQSPSMMVEDIVLRPQTGDINA